MHEIHTSLNDLEFVKPNPSEHAPITLGWFEAEHGRETLLLMGNAESEIGEPSLEAETEILEEFLTLEEKNEQITWMLKFADKIVGVAWIELTQNHNVLPPSVHLMIGDKEARGKGIGKAAMGAMINYVRQSVGLDVIYSRQLRSNVVVANMNKGFGFVDDGPSYIDENNLEWQNIKLSVRT